MADQAIEQLRIPTLLSYVRQLPQPDYLGAELFPAREVGELDYKYLTGANNTPVMASVIPFDAEAPVLSRYQPITVVQGQIPPTKAKIRLDERTMHLLLSPRPGTSDFDDAITAIYDDVRTVVSAVEARIEYLRFQALSTGRIDIADPESGVRLSADYGLDPTQKVTCDGVSGRPAPWGDAANRRILDNIQAWTDYMESFSGVRPTRALTSRKVLSYMLGDASIRDAFWNTQNSRRPITADDLAAALDRMDLPEIMVYERRARVQNADGTYSTVRFLPDNLFILLPPDELGNTLYAPTVEALRAIRDGRVTAGDARRIFVEVWETGEPPAHWTKASSLAFPVFPRAGEILIANVDPA